MRVRVKICGITRAEDARAAALAGADAVGLVFYPPSPRAVDLERAQAAVAGLPAFVARVGVFVDPEPEAVRAAVAAAALDLLQFQGREPPELCRAFGRPYLKALRAAPGTDLAAEARRYSDACAILVDTHRPGVPGGTGEAFDWSLIPPSLGRPPGARPLVLAGGLHPGNVAEAVRRVRPWAVDVSSGVEAAPGIKDAALVAAFVREVQGAGS